MSDARSVEPPAISMLLTMHRRDDPDLYDELVRFKQGYRRVGRLKLLAHDGLKGPAKDDSAPIVVEPAITAQAKHRVFAVLGPPTD